MLSCYFVGNWHIWIGAFIVFIVLFLFFLFGFALHIHEDVKREDEPKAWAEWRVLVKLELCLIVIFLLVPSSDFIARYFPCK